MVDGRAGVLGAAASQMARDFVAAEQRLVSEHVPILHRLTVARHVEANPLKLPVVQHLQVCTTQTSQNQ